MKALPSVTPAALNTAMSQAGPLTSPDFHTLDFRTTAFASNPALGKLRIWSPDIIIGEVVNNKIVAKSGFVSVNGTFPTIQ